MNLSTPIAIIGELDIILSVVPNQVMNLKAKLFKNERLINPCWCNCIMRYVKDKMRLVPTRTTINAS